ncbi:MAG: response regulator, partial [Lachnospiraceae bacterium]|nr:response regulator [Lachnospiraceae bacterium]
MRLLLAEDEQDLNTILTKKLTEEGYSVDSCLTGTDALDYLAAANYDGAVLDVMMPGMDGFTVLKRIREKG